MQRKVLVVGLIVDRAVRGLRRRPHRLLDRVLSRDVQIRVPIPQRALVFHELHGGCRTMMEGIMEGGEGS